MLAEITDDAATPRVHCPGIILAYTYSRKQTVLRLHSSILSHSPTASSPSLLPVPDNDRNKPLNTRFASLFITQTDKFAFVIANMRM